MNSALEINCESPLNGEPLEWGTAMRRNSIASIIRQRL